MYILSTCTCIGHGNFRLSQDTNYISYQGKTKSLYSIVIILFNKNFKLFLYINVQNLLKFSQCILKYFIIH